MRVPSYGNLTIKLRDDYIHYKSIERTQKVLSLAISDDVSDPLYFWQLYSILGDKPLEKLVGKFYENVFKDEEDWFREAFEQTGDIEYHIKGQCDFWLDAMGKGPTYKGGYGKLKLKHKLVEEVMTEKGGKRWMYHMKNTLQELKPNLEYDRRIVPCIQDFLDFFMKKYSIEFDFNLYELLNKPSKL